MVLSSKIKGVFVLLVVLFLMQRCTQTENTEQANAAKDSVAACKTKPLNPNGDSEMALLMRSMNKSTASFKELIKQGKLPEKFPAEFLKIHTAKHTDETTKTPVFDGFANNYINQLNNLYGSPKEELTKNYNAFVQACVDCHKAFCPGPIKTINKLKV
jgi:hypothetical protein